MQGTEAVRRTYGEHNVWDYFDTDVSGEIPCNRAGVFFHILHAESTNGARIESYNVSQKWVDVTLYGPITDDANGDLDPNEQKAEAGRGRKLTAAEVDGGSRYQGFEPEACLRAKYRLYRGHVETHFEEDEFDGLVERFRELGVVGRPLENLCSVLGLRRVK